MPYEPPDRRPAVIFDFGNVVAFFDYGRAFRALAEPRGIDGDTLHRAARERGLLDQVSAFERGAIVAEAFADRVTRSIELEVDPGEFLAAWADIFRLNREIVPLVHALDREGYRLLLGSNTNPTHAEHFRRAFDETISRFRRLILSYEVGHSKPAPEFFRACVDAAGLPAEECVFIDDLPDNVDGARRAGLVGLHFRDVPTLIGDLRAAGLRFDHP